MYRTGFEYSSWIWKGCSHFIAHWQFVSLVNWIIVVISMRALNLGFWFWIFFSVCLAKTKQLTMAQFYFISDCTLATCSSMILRKLDASPLLWETPFWKSISAYIAKDIVPKSLISGYLGLQYVTEIVPSL